MLVFNSHVPSTVATGKRKRDLAEKRMYLGNEAQVSGVAQPAADAWIVGGDLNLSEAQKAANATSTSDAFVPSTEGPAAACGSPSARRDAAM